MGPEHLRGRESPGHHRDIAFDGGGDDLLVHDRRDQELRPRIDRRVRLLGGQNCSGADDDLALGELTDQIECPRNGERELTHAKPAADGRVHRGRCRLTKTGAEDRTGPCVLEKTYKLFG